ncbi:cyclic nucleotide-binding domain-containing protein [Paraliomyxa miuraensis]|uniref:cyclic nucleotide-binding domain-containing protein n=1 Tax=Paraliomyxa miuraensis TaxID=376150 RepID=UPI00224EB9CF|nr:cyclic nucleotide-binding domain-containing protein [Paraliomyxa miuraensis]MCX4243495.1 cyclic nucleotide-binding domain-containing protein [Paraliomyxa miuraensis]
MIEHPFFEGLDTDSEGVARVLRRRALVKDEVLFRQGEVADAVFFVVSGRIGVDVRLPGGRVSRLARLGPGSVVGEFGFMEPRHRRTGTVVAVEPTALLVMLRRDLDALCRHHHPASLTILQRLMRQACASIEDLNDERIALARAPRSTVPRVGSRVEPRVGSRAGPRVGSGGGPEPRFGADFELMRYFYRLPFFEGFSDEESGTLVAHARPWTCDEAVTLFRAGGSEGAIWIVVRASVELGVDTPHGPHRMAVVGPGQAFVDPGALSGRPQRLLAVAREGATLLELPSKSVERLFDPRQRLSYPFCWAMARGLMERLTIDTRALAHEWRAATRGTKRPFEQDPSRSGLFRIVAD